MSKPKAYVIILSMIVSFAIVAGATGVQAQSLKKAPPKPSPAEKTHDADPPTGVLLKMVGTWDVQARLFMDPNAEPIEMKGTSINTMELTGKFLQSRFKGEFMGDTLVGMGYDCWDPARQKFVGVWMDSQFPGIGRYEGTWDPETKTLTSFGENVDPESGSPYTVKSVTTFRSSSMYTYEGWKQGADGEWFKEFEAIFGKVE